MTPATQNVQQLLKLHGKLCGELDRHQRMIEEFRSAEAKLVATMDLDNQEQFKQLSDIRLRRELLPAKVRCFEEAIAKTKEELLPACQALAEELLPVVRRKYHAIESAVRAAINPFVGVNGGCSDVSILVREIAQLGPDAAYYISIESMCGNTLSVLPMYLLRRAVELVESAERLLK